MAKDNYSGSMKSDTKSGCLDYSEGSTKGLKTNLPANKSTIEEHKLQHSDYSELIDNKEGGL